MNLEEFVESISKYEYFEYSHIMEIPETSFEYAKRLNHNQWKLVYNQSNAIALCCIKSDRVHILFPHIFFSNLNIPNNSIIDKGHLVLVRSLISKVEVFWPNEDNSLWFSNKQKTFGQMNIYYKESVDNLFENIILNNSNFNSDNKKSKEMNYLETLESTINSLGEMQSLDLIRLILKDLINNDEHEYMNAKSSQSVEDKLSDLRNRYESKYGSSTMNLIPSDKKGACHTFCLAIANKKFDKLRRDLNCGFRGAMLEMSAYWFNCLSVNKETLIITSSWDNDIFEEQYKKIIDSYRTAHNKAVIIIEFGPTGFFKRYPY
jgi:hypothetical protein